MGSKPESHFSEARSSIKVSRLHGILGEQLVVEHAQAIEFNFVAQCHVALAEVDQTVDDAHYIGGRERRLLGNLCGHLLGGDDAVVVGAQAVPSLPSFISLLPLG